MVEINSKIITLKKNIHLLLTSSLYLYQHLLFRHPVVPNKQSVTHQVKNKGRKRKTKQCISRHQNNWSLTIIQQAFQLKLLVLFLKQLFFAINFFTQKAIHPIEYKFLHHLFNNMKQSSVYRYCVCTIIVQMY